jgi:hypothetical protein
MKRRIRRQGTVRRAGRVKKIATCDLLRTRQARPGKHAATVARDVTRAKALGPDLDRVEGTSLDQGAELDALAKMPAPERQAIMSQAATPDQTHRRSAGRRQFLTRQPPPISLRDCAPLRLRGEECFRPRGQELRR